MKGSASAIPHNKLKVFCMNFLLTLAILLLWIPSKDKPIKVLLVKALKNPSILIKNRGGAYVSCNGRKYIPEFGTIKDDLMKLKEMEERWLFVPIAEDDSSLFFLGEQTWDFALELKEKDSAVGLISVYCTQTEMIGIFHTVYGKLKPAKSRDICFFTEMLWKP